MTQSTLRDSLAGVMHARRIFVGHSMSPVRTKNQTSVTDNGGCASLAQDFRRMVLFIDIRISTQCLRSSQITVEILSLGFLFGVCSL